MESTEELCIKFNENKHSHPLIYMRGMTSDPLDNVLDFIYHGESGSVKNLFVGSWDLEKYPGINQV